MSVRQVTPRWNAGTRLAVRNVLQQFLDAEAQKVGFLRSLLEVEAGVADAAAAALRGVHQDAEQVPLILYPLDTGCLPLSYGENPGVNGVSHRGGVGAVAGCRAFQEGGGVQHGGAGASGGRAGCARGGEVHPCVAGARGAAVGRGGGRPRAIRAHRRPACLLYPPDAADE